MMVEIVNPFVGGARIHQVQEVQKKAEQIDHLNQLLAKRKDIEVNHSLIQNYINKATIR